MNVFWWFSKYLIGMVSWHPTPSHDTRASMEYHYFVCRWLALVHHSPSRSSFFNVIYFLQRPLFLASIIHFTFSRDKVQRRGVERQLKRYSPCPQLVELPSIYFFNETLQPLFFSRKYDIRNWESHPYRYVQLPIAMSWYNFLEGFIYLLFFLRAESKAIDSYFSGTG